MVVESESKSESEFGSREVGELFTESESESGLDPGVGAVAILFFPDPWLKSIR